MFMYEILSKNLHGLSAALFTRGLGWSVEQLEVFLIDVRRELKDPSVHTYWPLLVYTPSPAETEELTRKGSYVIYAQKPVV